MKQAIVVLDPGHGGWDAGIEEAGAKEKDINLGVCLKLREILQAAGVQVVLTRKEDREVTAGKRADEANQPGVDLFVSWHCDSLEDASVNGLSLYVDSRCPDLIRRMIEFELIGNRIAEESGQLMMGVFQERDRVLSQAEPPAVLIRGAFLTNAQEREQAVRAEFQEKQAAGAAKGILKFLELNRL